MPRPLLTGCAATVMAATALALSGLALPVSAASAATAQPQSTAQAAPGAPPVSLAITSVSPMYATPGKTVTVSGTLTNTSSTRQSGLSIQLRSGSPFDSRNQLQDYADGSYLGDEPVIGAVMTVAKPLAPRATVQWSVALSPSAVPMTTLFGVYPLAAEAENASGTSLTVSRTFLPFWPGTKAGDPQTEDIAWVWPLIDQPRQAICPGLLNNGLAASLASGGRLRGLLQAGSTYASSAHLTWAIDPALLANVTTMTKPYTVTTPSKVRAGRCGGTNERASPAAADWLKELKSATTGQPVFVTPYADADIAALIGSGMNADLTHAFTEGRAVASSLLSRSFSASAASVPASSTNLTGMAWPADGIANYADLENLAASDGINTVVLDSSTMPPSQTQDYTPTAQTTTPDGVGAPLKVLLSDDTITQILGSANSPSDSKATAFSVEQRYLAETAMIAAEQPSIARAVVVAPPQRWDPPAGLASDVLAETVQAPWLRPVSLASLAAVKHPSGQVSRQPPRAHSQAELGKPLLSQARQLDQQARLLKSVEQEPGPALNNAAVAVESSAWRGGSRAGQQGAALAQQLLGYLRSKEGELTVLGVRNVTLGGLKGTVPVSISNGLSYTVHVKLQAESSGGVTGAGPPRTVVVPPGEQETFRVAVTATNVGSTTLVFRLLTPEGAPFPAKTSMTVQATNYGTLALVIIAAALGVFVLTAGARALRRTRRRLRPGPSDSGDQAAGPRDTDRDPQDAAAEPDWRDKPDEADNVVADGSRASGHDPAEETDDYAWTPGPGDRR
jgi:Family of unknown function (DUF6049)